MKKKRKAKKNASHSLGNPQTESGLLSTLIKVVNFARVALNIAKRSDQRRKKKRRRRNKEGVRIGPLAKQTLQLHC
jgi:hypothetical protein